MEQPADGIENDLNVCPLSYTSIHSGSTEDIGELASNLQDNKLDNTKSSPTRYSINNLQDGSGPSGSNTTMDSTEQIQCTERFNKRDFITVTILFFVNLLNYMDRFTIAGVLPKVKTYYDNLSDSEAGLIQTSFVCSYMILAPIFGYLGDRYSRKIIMAIGIAFWSATTLLGSFVPNGYFRWFLLLRGLVGVGEASYSTIAPTIIADLYDGKMRSRMLALFYFAVPVGSGLGYIIGSNVAYVLNSWHWALRVTPPLGVFCTVLVIFVMKEPSRGEKEGAHHLQATSWLEDLRSLSKNQSFMWSTIGFTCVAFVAGALSWWGPTFLVYSIEVQGQKAELSEVSLIFGVITVVAGIVGVASGAATAQHFKSRYITADPLVCAFGMVGSMPFLFLGAVVSKYNTIFAYLLIFIGETLLCLNWSLVADILLYVVIPTRRSTAEAFQILLSHALGDAGSPYIIGLVSDSIAKDRPKSEITKFISLEYALFITCFVSVLGGFCFIVTSWHIAEDKKRVDLAVQGMPQANGNGEGNPLTLTPVSSSSHTTPTETNFKAQKTQVVNGVPRTSL